MTGKCSDCAGWPRCCYSDKARGLPCVDFRPWRREKRENLLQTDRTPKRVRSRKNMDPEKDQRDPAGACKKSIGDKDRKINDGHF